MRRSEIAFGCGSAAVLVAALVVAEITLPLPAKPSILLRASTGALPTRDLEAAYTAEAEHAEAARLEAQNAAARVAGIQAATGVAQQAVRALDKRIRDKQSSEWAAAPPPMPSP